MKKNKLKSEVDIPRMRGRVMDLVSGIGDSVPFTCPECSGPIREIKDSILVRFRCQVGHAYSAQAMFAGRLESLEADLWHLVSSSEEARRLALLLARQAHREKLPDVARDFERAAQGCLAQSEAIQQLLQRMPSARYDERSSGRRALRLGSRAEVKARVPGRERNA